MRRGAVSLLIAAGLLAGCATPPPRSSLAPVVVQTAPPPPPPPLRPSQAQKELNRVKIVTVTEPEQLASAIAHELAALDPGQRAVADGRVLVPDRLRVTFMSAAERTASGHVKVGLEVFGLGGEATVDSTASLEELQEIAMTFAIDGKKAGTLAGPAPKIRIDIGPAVEELRDDLRAFAKTGNDYLVPGCAKLTKHFELDSGVKAGGDIGIKIVHGGVETEFGGHVADTLEISFKLSGYKGECEL